ncbi:leucine-rich repeats and immunoglobulin-like domains protein 2 [Clavelina lepadiformis]|uniref:Ig-like domain-containing protein n=1 Tax=Clavelina lepadiformis TaxID=159417 RepID=A0ABP0GHS2_CLALP
MFQHDERNSNLNNMPLDRRKLPCLATHFAFDWTNRFYLIFLILCLCQVVVTSEKSNFVYSSCPQQCTCSFNERLVNCSNRSLRQIPKPIPSWVSILIFRNNKISANEIQRDIFSHLKHLQEIDFSDNRLNEVNLSLEDVPQLRILRFDRCSLDKIPDVGVNTGINITILSLSHNSISEIGGKLKLFPSLQNLDLSFNRLKHLRNYAFSKQTKLTELNLHKNKISAIDSQALAGLRSLRHLSLSRNKLRVFRHSSSSDRSKSNKKCVGNLCSLRYLDLSRNHISRIEGLAFSGMRHLHTLLLSDNRIGSLMDGAFFSLKDLTVLRMDNNLITSVIKGWLFELQSLQILSLSHNNVSNITPTGWKFCEKLRHLNLSYNDMRTLSTGLFKHLTHLETLDLKHNLIDVVEDNAFLDVVSLHTLDLSHNSISSSVEDIHGAFLGLSGLRRLLLNDNKIRCLSSNVLRGAEGLTELDLRRNNITSVENGTFSALKSLYFLRMDSSSFLCDCQLAWFPTWLSTYESKHNSSFEVHTFCFHPPRLKGRELSTVKREELECGKHPVPALLQEPSLLTSYKGENVTLECSASATVVEGQIVDANVEMTVVWRRGPTRSEIKESSSIRIRNRQTREGGHIFFTSLLLLYNVGYDDDKKYSCVISNDFGHDMSTPARLRVFAAPLLIKKPENKTVRMGSEAILSCQASGQPLPKISWHKTGVNFPAADERRLQVGDERSKSSPSEESDASKRPLNDVTGLTRPRASRFISASSERNSMKITSDGVKDGPLHIVNVKPQDAGEYTCMAKSEAGSETAFVTLTVLYAPIVEDMPEEVNAIYGGNAVLKCMVTAYPAPEVTWRMNSSILKGTDRHFFAADGQILVIVKAGSNDEGIYTCFASNDLGTNHKSTNLVLKESLDENATKGVFDELFGTNGIVVVIVFICVLATSLIWLIVLCYTRKNHEGAYSTNTDASDLSPVDSSSHGSLDKPCNHARSMQSSMNMTGLRSKPDLNLNNRCYGDRLVTPNLLARSHRPNLAHGESSRTMPNLRPNYRSFPRHYGLPSKQMGYSSPNPGDRFIVYDRRVSARPPMRAASTSHVHNMQVEPTNRHTNVSNSTQCIPESARYKHPVQRVMNAQHHRFCAPQAKRRRRRKRVDDEVRESVGGSCNPASNSDSSDEPDERQRLVNPLPGLTVTQDKARKKDSSVSTSAACGEQERLLKLSGMRPNGQPPNIIDNDTSCQVQTNVRPHYAPLSSNVNNNTSEGLEDEDCDIKQSNTLLNKPIFPSTTNDVLS